MVQHVSDATSVLITVGYKSRSPTLYHLQFVHKVLGMWVLNTGAVLKLRSDQCKVCCRLDQDFQTDHYKLKVNMSAIVVVVNL